MDLVMGHECVVVVGLEGGGQNCDVQSEQKRANWTRYLIANLSKERHLGVYPRAGMFSLAKAGMMLPPNHRWSVGCKIDAVCSNACLPSVVKPFAEQG